MSCNCETGTYSVAALAYSKCRNSCRAGLPSGFLAPISILIRPRYRPMPCWLCTTGSPMFSSDKSRIRVSTSLACSCLRRRRVLAGRAKSSVSVMKAMPRSVSPKPRANCPTAMPSGSVLSANSFRLAKPTGCKPLARKKSKRLSRRPSLSAKNKARSRLLLRYCLSLASGSSALRSAAKAGKAMAKSGSCPASTVRKASCAQGLALW